jgi:hypothetical protein
MDDNLQSMDVVMGEPKPETNDQENDQELVEEKKTENSYSTREEEKRIREETRKQKAEEQKKRAEERRQKAEEREQVKKQKEEEKEKKLLEKRKREEEREEARIQREEERERRLKEKKRKSEEYEAAKQQREEERRKKSEEYEAAKQQREEERRQKQEEIQGRLCKGTCGKYRSRNPPRSQQSRWFVCYGCKSYCLCLICGSTRTESLNGFQEHAEKCDPYYNDRIGQNSQVRNMIIAQTYVPPPPQPVSQPIKYEDEEADYEPDPYAMNLPAPALNLLNYYQPPVSVGYVESTYKGCWTGDSRILKFDGTFIHARDVVPGDKLLSSTGSCAIVNAVIISEISDPVKIVQLSQHCSVTSGHPIFNPSIGDYVRADSLKPTSLSKIDKLFNFELNRECEGLTCDGGILGATVGKSFDLVKKFSPENDTIWGCNYWSTTKSKLQQNYFPNISYLTKECNHTD